MNSLDYLRLAKNSLWRRKARTFLTVSGVLIGTTAIVVMLSIGLGLDSNQRKQMEQWGDLNNIRVNQGVNYDNEGNPIGEAKVLNDEAVDEIRSLEGVVAVAPAFEAGGEARFGRKRGYVQLVGIDPSEMSKFGFKTSDGRLLAEGDRSVMVVGQQVINNFMDEAERRKMEQGNYMGPMEWVPADPTEMLDQRVYMQVYAQGQMDKKKLFNFTVVGILDGEYSDHAWQAYAPLDEIKRMRKFMMGSSGGNMAGPYMTREMPVGKGNAGGNKNRNTEDNYNFITVRTADVEHSKNVSQELRDRGYNCWTMADQLEGIEQSSRTIQAVLGGIGGITLLVAAIGITNTMVMSIYERTREIGVMKVMGATFNDIRSIFLFEAGLIGLIGGTLGLAISFLVSYIINILSQGYLNQGMYMATEEALKISIIPPWLAAFAIVFSILIGLISGMYPANRAVRLSPVDAIRNSI